MPKKKAPVQRKQSGVRLNTELMKNLKHLAVDREMSFNSLVEEAIEDILKKYKTKK